LECEAANLKTSDQKIQISSEFASLVANDSSELPAKSAFRKQQVLQASKVADNPVFESLTSTEQKPSG
jgi:hypothetical protein